MIHIDNHQRPQNQIGFSRLPQDNHRILEEIRSLRYQVYCNERRIFPKTGHRNHRESDQFDAHSIHFYAHDRLYSNIMGTMRLVRHSPLGFPIEKYYKIQTDIISPEQKRNSVEISRLAISKERVRQALKSHTDRPNNYRSIIINGLFRIALEHSKLEGVTHLIAAMEPALARLLRTYHIEFKQIGPIMDYFGPVAPFIAKTSNIEQSLIQFCPGFFGFDQGTTARDYGYAVAS